MRVLISATLISFIPSHSGTVAAITESEARSQLNSVNAELDAAGNDYQRIVGEIDEIDARISQVEAEIAAQNQKYEEVNRALDARFKAIYKYSDASPFELVLASRDFDDFAQRIALLSRLAYSDEKLMKEAADQRTILQRKEEELAREKDNRQTALIDLGGQRREIETRLKEKEAALSSAAAPPQSPGETVKPKEPVAPVGGTLTGHSETGDASYYSFTGGYTAAHKFLPLGTMVRVTNTANGNQVWVEIVDRGPWGAGRIIDLEETAFAKIADLSEGVVFVLIEW